MKTLIKLTYKPIISSIIFSLTTIFCLFIGLKALAFLNNVNSGDTLTSGVWNELLSNLFWKDQGSGNITYTGGNVGIGTNNPTTKLEISGDIKANNIGPNSFSRIAASISCLGKTKSVWHYTTTNCPSGQSIIFVGILNENHVDTHAISCQLNGNGIQAGTWCANNIDGNNSVTCYGLCVKN